MKRCNGELEKMQSLEFFLFTDFRSGTKKKNYHTWKVFFSSSAGVQLSRLLIGRLLGCPSVFVVSWEPTTIFLSHFFSVCVSVWVSCRVHKHHHRWGAHTHEMEGTQVTASSNGSSAAFLHSSNLHMTKPWILATGIVPGRFIYRWNPWGHGNSMPTA